MNQYPDDNELRQLEEWDFLKKPIGEFLAEIKRLWWMPDWGYSITGKNVLYLQLHTGGWSGNESIVEALEKNFVFWGMCWVKSQRGGHYWFIVKTKLFSPPPSDGESKS